MKKWLDNMIWFERRKLLRCLMIVLGMAGMIYVLERAAKTEWEMDGAEVSNLLVRTEDSKICVSWRNPFDWKFRGTEILIHSDTKDYVETLSSSQSSFEFTEGVSGEKYIFTVRAKYSRDIVSTGVTGEALFLDYSKVPDFPLLVVDTIGYVEPPSEEAERPEGCWGHTITGNDYVPGILKLFQNGIAKMETETKIKVRGNTSAFGEKKPYKIKLDKADDLLDRGDDGYDSRNWVLLDDTSLTSTVAGMKVAEKCGLEWQPEYEFVNVIINGDFRGCYLLSEAVEKGEKRCNISDSGYMIENDVYWWNQDDVYFRTQHQIYEVGYTFKYPEARLVNDSIKHGIRDYLNEFEDALFNGDEGFEEYIDMQTWAAWLLVHDIMGTKDAGGANIFLYKYDLNQNNPTSTPLKMGPVWDFGSAYSTEDAWANVHEGPISDVFYFPQLLQYESFRKEYRELWQSISDDIEMDIIQFEKELYNEKGAALQESRNLEARYSGIEAGSVEGEIQEALDWFSKRIAWINNAVSDF